MLRRAAAIVAACVLLAAPAELLAAPLRAGDRIAVTVFNHPELGVPQGTLDGDGKLALPLVGNVAIAGLEPEAAAARLGNSLKTYLREPVVSVSVVQQNASISLVGGPVSTLPFVPGQGLSSIVAPLISNAGLDLHHVTIQRDKSTLGSYDALALLRNADPGPLLQPGDQIVLAQNPVGVNVLGSVRTPGMAYLAAGASIADAVNAAGGATAGAATGAVDLLRGGTHQYLALSSDAAMQPARDGDVVSVPLAVHVAVGGLVGHPGDTALTSGNTLIAAIYQAGGPVRYSDLNHTEVIHDGVRSVYDITKVPHGDRSQNPHLSEGDIVNVPQGGHLNLGDIFGAAGIVHWFF